MALLVFFTLDCWPYLNLKYLNQDDGYFFVEGFVIKILFRFFILSFVFNISAVEHALIFITKRPDSGDLFSPRAVWYTSGGRPFKFDFARYDDLTSAVDRLKLFIFEQQPKESRLDFGDVQSYLTIRCKCLVIFLQDGVPLVNEFMHDGRKYALIEMDRDFIAEQIFNPSWPTHFQSLRIFFGPTSLAEVFLYLKKEK